VLTSHQRFHRESRRLGPGSAWPETRRYRDQTINQTQLTTQHTAACIGTKQRITGRGGGRSPHNLLLELLVDRQIGGPLRHAPVGVPVLLLRLLLAPESGLPEPLEILGTTNAETGVNIPHGSERPLRREVRNMSYSPLIHGRRRASAAACPRYLGGGRERASDWSRRVYSPRRLGGEGGRELVPGRDPGVGPAKLCRGANEVTLAQIRPIRRVAHV